jgi:sodium-independent sulfate anion transporter 11
MAYAKLAQLPPEYGLYTSFIGGMAYWMFGTSKDINIGPVAVASIVTGSIIGRVTNDFPDESHILIAGTISLLAGAVVAGIGVLRLGWLVNLISSPAVSAFISGSAITITFAQLPPLLGIRGVSTTHSAFDMLVSIIKKLKTTQIDAALGIICLIMLYLIKWGCARLGERRPNIAKAVFFVSTLRTIFIILLCILMSFIVNRNHKDNPSFRVLGFVPRGESHTTRTNLSGKTRQFERNARNTT